MVSGTRSSCGVLHLIRTGVEPGVPRALGGVGESAVGGPQSPPVMAAVKAMTRPSGKRAAIQKMLPPVPLLSKEASPNQRQECSRNPGAVHGRQLAEVCAYLFRRSASTCGLRGVTAAKNVSGDSPRTNRKRGLLISLRKAMWLTASFWFA